MLMGLALSAAGVGAAAALQPSAFIEAVLLVLAIAAWFIGACGMVGYVRWFFASERLQAMRDRADAVEREKSESRSAGL
jgi:flagellar basal body-associated protein FliL